MELRDAACLVTGASSGIGQATALALTRAGARVAVHGRNRRELHRLAGGRGWPILVADLRTPEEVDRCAEEALEALGRVDVLVNNAAVGWGGPFVDMDLTEAQEIVAVNLLAPIRLTRSLVPGMVGRGRGHVVNVASIAGHVGVAAEAVYAATKGGLITFSESLRYELRGSGVGVTVVSPGAVRTAFFERRGRPYGRRFPRPVPPERVAGALVAAVLHDRPQVFVPRWLAFPPSLRGAWPSLYRALQSRFG